MTDDCTQLPSDDYVYGKAKTTGLMGRSENLLFNTQGHFRYKDRLRSSIFHPETDQVLKYHLAEYGVPVVQSSPMFVREVKPESSLKYTLKYRGLRHSEWDFTRPSVSLESGAFTPFHIGYSTLFHYDAFWAFPPTLFYERLQSLWWSFAVQKLLWLTGNNVHVTSRRSIQYDLHVHENSTSKIDATLNYLISFLRNWKCNDVFIRCSKQLFSDLYSHSYMSKHNFHMINNWFSTLDANGYKWPNTTFNTDLKLITSVQLTASEQNKPHLCPAKDCVSRDIEKSYRRVFQKSHFYTNNSDMILLIEFNHPTYSAIPFLEYLYRPAFKNIIYCGPKELDRPYNVDFVSFNGKGGGTLFYTCVAFLLQIAFKVKGILLISDDVIVNFNRWTSIDKSRSVMTYADTDGIRLYDTNKMTRCLTDVYNCTSPPKWWWMTSRKRTNVVRTVYDEIHDLERTDVDVKQALTRVKNNFGSKERMLTAYNDMFYIPQSLAHGYVKYSQLFERHRLFGENAGPTISMFISSPTDIQLEKAIQMPYTADRSRPWVRWHDFEGSHDLMYIHPVKLGKVNTDRNIKKLFCESVILEMIRSMSSVRKTNATKAKTQWKDVLYVRYHFN